MQDDNQLPSKTQIKKQMNHLQDLGMALTRLSENILTKMDLPADLYQAIADYKKIKSNSALKRQAQYIGRLMREIDPTPIEAHLARLNGENTAYNAMLQRVELWRDKLLDSDEQLSSFIAQFPDVDISRLRMLIRNARKEKEQTKPPKAYREIFQVVKLQLDKEQSDDSGR